MADAALPGNFGRYRPLRVLGEGAAGTVYLAQDPVLDRQVTVKVIRTAGLDETMRRDFLERFAVEAKAAARCAHPGIVALHDYAESDGTPFIVMEYIDGPTLYRALHEPALRSGIDPIGVTLQILDALGAAHGHGITHRDIKPANLLMTRDGRVKIADFGIARLDRIVLTQYTAMVGTPSYMAPEQAGGQPIDHRADLFATGAILYEMLAGKPPFLGSNLPETLANLLGPSPVATALLPPVLAPILARALAKAPEARFQSAAEFAAALHSAAAAGGDATIIAPPVPGHRPDSMAGATAWDTDYLRALETVLARHLGPIAGVLIRNAAARATAVPALHDALAGSIDRHAARSEFLRDAAQLRPQAETSTPVAAAPAPSVAAAPAQPLPPEILQEAEAALARHIGPIARLLVRQAADRSGSTAEFRDRLAANLTRPEEASEFRRRLDQALARLNRP